MSSFDPYRLLGVDRNASQQEIKKAYRRLALDCHPDRCPGDAGAEERFKQISKAYEILKDPRKRERFDRFGSTGEGPDFSDIFGGGFGIEDALRSFMENFGFGGFASGGRRGGSPPGRDITLDVELDIKEVALGASREIDVVRSEPCDQCDGTGADPQSGLEDCPSCDGQGSVRTTRRTILGSFSSIRHCSRCNGTGRVPVKKCGRCHGSGRRSVDRKIKVDIPAGVSRGHFLRLSGQGDYPGGNGRPGDLIIHIASVDYGPFSRDGDDIVYSHRISFPEAALGTTITVPTPSGEEQKVDVDGGVQPGDILLLKGKGLGSLSGRGRGNLKIRLDVYVPAKLSREERRILEQLSDSRRFKPK